MHRRCFLQNAAGIFVCTNLSKMPDFDHRHANLKTIKVSETVSSFERESLVHPFGFKGGYLTELWQTYVKLRTTSSEGIGLGTQSVLYGDAALFKRFSEAGGNAMMYALTEHA